MAGWDESRLAALRARYGADRGGETRDPRFAAVAARVFQGGRRSQPYAGVATLLDAPLRQVDPERPDFGGLDVALTGMPFDLGVTNRAGARLGPRALRQVERIGPYHHVHGIAPMHVLRVADVGDVPLASRYDLAGGHDDLERWIGQMRDAGVRPLVAGGDHSITRPILRALGRDRPLGLIHVDAHSDTSGPFEGTRFHHGGPFRQAVLDGVLDPTRTVQIGIRGPAEYLWEFAADAGMTVIHAEEIDRLGLAAVIARARAVVGQGPAYLSFDIDALDPAFAPGTGTPEAGGLSTREALALLRGMAGMAIVGGDLVEVAPQYDPGTVTAQAGAQILFEILCLMALAPR